MTKPIDSSHTRYRAVETQGDVTASAAVVGGIEDSRAREAAMKTAIAVSENQSGFYGSRSGGGRIVGRGNPAAAMRKEVAFGKIHSLSTDPLEVTIVGMGRMNFGPGEEIELYLPPGTYEILTYKEGWGKAVSQKESIRIRDSSRHDFSIHLRGR
jgi:hypothetical protein